MPVLLYHRWSSNADAMERGAPSPMCAIGARRLFPPMDSTVTSPPQGGSSWVPLSRVSLLESRMPESRENTTAYLHDGAYLQSRAGLRPVGRSIARLMFDGWVFRTQAIASAVCLSLGLSVPTPLCSLQSTDLGRPSLELEQVMLIPVPSDWPISGIAPAGDDAVLTWNYSDSWVAVLNKEGSILRVGEGILRQPVAASMLPDGRIEVVERGGSLVILDREEDAWTREEIHTPLNSILAAARAEDAWYVGGWTQPDTAWVAFRVEANRSTLPIISFPRDLVGSFGAHLTARTSGIVATVVDAPFSAVARTSTGSSLTLSPPDPGAFGTGGDARWHSMGVLELRPGWLQILYDLRTDQRILVTYGRDGDVIRAIRIPVAIGLFTNGSRPRTVIGMRDVGSGEKEIIVYAWRWDGMGRL